jgi:ABC-type Fe3+-hydroxamate transport system substrate-binding protein
MPVLLDDLMTPVDLRAPVRRVVSLVPSLTEAIAVSGPGLLVGATDWCSRPGDLEVTRVRGTKNPDLTAITGLRPDLVVANVEENREIDVRRLRAAGVPVWVTRIESIDSAFAAMSRLFEDALGLDQPEWIREAQEVWAAPAELPPLRTAVAVWRDPWMLVGRDTYAGDLVGRLGLVHVHRAEASRYPSVDLAAIDRPGIDLVLLPDEPYPFSTDDGPEAFSSSTPVLLGGRHLTWYGPSMVEARLRIAEAVRRSTAAR